MSLNEYGKKISTEEITRQAAEAVEKEKKSLIQICIEFLSLNGYTVKKRT